MQKWWSPPRSTGLGGVAFHLAQFNTSSAFPRARGLVSGAFVAGFVGSGLAFFVLRAIINILGGSAEAYRPAASFLCSSRLSTTALACPFEDLDKCPAAEVVAAHTPGLRESIQNIQTSCCRGVLLVFAALVALWMPLGLWAFPRRPLQLGQVCFLNCILLPANWRALVPTMQRCNEVG